VTSFARAILEEFVSDRLLFEGPLAICFFIEHLEARI
jgi:hypothetical protein